MFSVVDSRDVSPPAARAGLSLSAVAVLPALLVVVAMSPAAVDLVRYWIDVVDYHYGFLVAAVAIVWFAKALPAAAAQSAGPNGWLLATLGAGLFFWYALWQGNSALGAQMLLPPAVWLSVATVIGWRAAVPLAGPIGYLYFAMPVWDLLLPTLQAGTIFGAEQSMKLFGIPVTVNGALVSIAAGTFEVAYSCSGLRYLVVALALAVLVAIVDRMSVRRTLVLLAISVALAIFANWVRVFIVMYAGHITGMSHYFVTDSHEGIGNAVFVVLLVIIFFVSRWLTGPAQNASVSIGSTPASASARRAAFAVAAVAVVFGLLAARAAWSATSVATPQLQPMPSGRADEWQGPLPSMSSWLPQFADAQQSVKISYRPSAAYSTIATENPPLRIEVYANVYGVQRRGSELVFFDNTLLAPGKWQYVRGWAAARGAAGMFAPRLSINEYLIDRQERWLVGRTYVVGGSSVSSEFAAQLLYGFSTLTNPSPAGVIALAVQCHADCGGAHAVMQRFWSGMADPLVDILPTDMETAPRP